MYYEVGTWWSKLSNTGKCDVFDTKVTQPRMPSAKSGHGACTLSIITL